VCRRKQYLRASGGPSLPGRLERVRLSRERKPTQARVVSVCRLRRNQAGRATSFAQIARHLRPCWGRLPLLGDGGARLRGNELGSLRTPPPIARDQRAVAASTIEVLRTDQVGRELRDRSCIKKKVTARCGTMGTAHALPLEMRDWLRLAGGHACGFHCPLF